MESLHPGLPPQLDTCLCPRLLRITIGVEMVNIPVVPGLLVLLLEPTRNLPHKVYPVSWTASLAQQPACREQK